MRVVLYEQFSTLFLGWLGDAMVLGTLPVQGRLTNLINSRARACYACGKCGCFLFFFFSFLWTFFSRLSFLSSYSFSGRRPDID